MRRDPDPAPNRGDTRRRLLASTGRGLLFLSVGGCALPESGDPEAARRARAARRPDGRPRLPPGQYLRESLRDMGGQPGPPDYTGYRLQVHGEVDQPFVVDYAALLALPQTELTCDVHCVTRWSMLNTRWSGVRLAALAGRAGVRPGARWVVFEGAHGYTANVPLHEALAPNVLVAHHFGGDPLAHGHGGPARALVPDLYFWKSAKWLTGIRFSAADEPGYWETRGYHNHGDPWTEERYA